MARLGFAFGWLTVRDAGLRDRLTTAKMNIVISGSPLDETLAAAVLDNREMILEQALGGLLAAGLSKVAAWVDGPEGSCRVGEAGWRSPVLPSIKSRCFRCGAQLYRFWSTLPRSGPSDR